MRKLYVVITGVCATILFAMSCNRVKQTASAHTVGAKGPSAGEVFVRQGRYSCLVKASSLTLVNQDRILLQQHNVGRTVLIDVGERSKKYDGGICDPGAKYSGTGYYEALCGSKYEASVHGLGPPQYFYGDSTMSLRGNLPMEYLMNWGDGFLISLLTGEEVETDIGECSPVRGKPSPK